MQAYTAKTMLLKDRCDFNRPVAVFFSGCNFNCPYCNTSFINSFNEMFSKDIREIKKDILSYSAEADAVIFTGGEPTLQRQALVEIAKYAKSLGLKTCLETNASKPDTIKALLSLSALDSINISLWPFNEEKFERATRSKTFFTTTKQIISDIKKTIEIIKNKDIDITFTITVVPNILFKKEDIIDIIGQIKETNTPIILKKFYPENVFNKVYSNINEPSDGFLYDLATVLSKRFPNLDIRADISPAEYNAELFESYQQLKELNAEKDN